MSTSILSDQTWEAITATARRRAHRAWVAVAFFGKGGSDLLPLAPGSHLVVNASEGAVKQGLTHPDSLKRMIDTGVLVYGANDLHAKVFVFGKTAFVGSANASRHSADRLQEVVVRTTERAAVNGARTFVESQCLVELGPSELDRLQKLYRPPRSIPEYARRPRSNGRTKGGGLPRLIIAHSEWADPPPGSEETEQDGWNEARSKMEHPRLHELSDIHWHGRCLCRERDQVIELTTEHSGDVLVSPPATVLNTRQWSNGRASCTFVYLEAPRLRRKNIELVTRKLGRGAKKALHQGGLIRDQDLANRLRTIWKR